MSYRYNQEKTHKLYHHKQWRVAYQHEKGVVLVVALFIVALVAALSSVMMSRLERDITRLHLLLRNVQAEYDAMGSVAWAMDQLRNDWERQKENQVLDRIPIESPENTVNGYKIKSVISDMQGRFNLNNLVNPESYPDFKRLLQIVYPSLSQQKIEQIVKEVAEWVSSSDQNSVEGQYYLALKPPYRIAHRPMISRSELRLVKGVTPDLYHALAPYITALPTQTQVNVQTASPAVLASLSPTLPLATAMIITELRVHTPIVSVPAFMNLDMIRNHRVPNNKITVKSQYFLVETKVTIENQHVVLYTLLERLVKENKVIMQILWQSKGLW